VAAHFTVGSVKAQIGHLEAAAGLAGLLKVVLALGYRTIPGSPYLAEMNPHIDLTDACFGFSSESAPWKEPAVAGEPRRAGVSSFGFGGVNAHVVLEHAPALSPRIEPAMGSRLFILSARTAEALQARVSALADMLTTRRFANDEEEQTYLHDLAFTLRRKTPLRHRLTVVATSATELAARLRQWPDVNPDVVCGIAQAGAHEATSLFTNEAEVEERLRALVTGGELRKLAALWVKGFDMEWEHIVPRADAELINTPPYPFARESFWVTFGNADRPADSRRAVDLEAATPGTSDVDKIYVWHPPTPASALPSSGLLALESFTCESLVEG
jgi:acyl transferase domain-containing protein